jgi:hypothetical protein
MKQLTAFRAAKDLKILLPSASRYRRTVSSIFSLSGTGLTGGVPGCRAISVTSAHQRDTGVGKQLNGKIDILIAILSSYHESSPEIGSETASYEQQMAG